MRSSAAPVLPLCWARRCDAKCGHRSPSALPEEKQHPRGGPAALPAPQKRLTQRGAFPPCAFSSSFSPHPRRAGAILGTPPPFCGRALPGAQAAVTGLPWQRRPPGTARPRLHEGEAGAGAVAGDGGRPAGAARPHRGLAGGRGGAGMAPGGVRCVWGGCRGVCGEGGAVAVCGVLDSDPRSPTSSGQQH